MVERIDTSSCSSYGHGMDLTYRDYFGPPKLTKFDESMIQLDFLKYEIKAHVKKVNSIKLRYMDWFGRKQQTFLDSIKLIQILAAKMVPDDITTFGQFRQVHNMARRFPRNGTPRDSGPGKMDEFLMFWLELCDLKPETDELYNKICQYCDGVTRLRQPSVKGEVDRLYSRLNTEFSETFNFMHLHNERDNLFTYKVATFDHKYHGLLSFIPYLCMRIVRLFYWANKLHLEKE